MDGSDAQVKDLFQFSDDDCELESLNDGQSWQGEAASPLGEVSETEGPMEDDHEEQGEVSKLTNLEMDMVPTPPPSPASQCPRPSESSPSLAIDASVAFATPLRRST